MDPGYNFTFMCIKYPNFLIIDTYNFLNSSLYNSYTFYKNKRIFMIDGNYVPIYFIST